MAIKKSVILLVLFGLILRAPLLPAATTIKGTVVDVQGSKVKIEYNGEYAPSVGDPVEIGFEIGEDFAPVEGEWKIVEVNAQFAWAQAKGSGAGTPAIDYVAVMETQNPQDRADLTPPQDTPTNIPPGEGARLGVNITDLSADIRKDRNLPAFINGALVVDVEPGSPAEQGGIQKGDVIVEFQGKPVTTCTELVPVVLSMAPGTKARLIIYRDSQTLNLIVTMGRR